MTVFTPQAGTPHAPADPGSSLAGLPDRPTGTERRYALDYLALLAIAAALVAIEFQVGAVIALMLASGEALEDYGVRRARGSLSFAGRSHSTPCPHRRW